MFRKLKYVKVTFRLLKASLMAEMEYKMNFITSFFLINLWLLITVIFYKSMYSHVNFIGNWTENQALFFVATFNVVDGIFFLLFFRGMLGLQNSVNTGQYDYILTKPISSIFLTCFNQFDISRIINIFFSLVLLIYTLGGVEFNIIQLIFYIVMVANGVIIYGSIFLIINTLSFYFTNVFNIISIFFDILEIGRLPSTIAIGAIRGFFMFVLPILFIAGIPCEYLYSQNDFKLVFISTAVMFVFAIIAILFFKLSVKKYSGASA